MQRDSERASMAEPSLDEGLEREIQDDDRPCWKRFEREIGQEEGFQERNPRTVAKKREIGRRRKLRRDVCFFNSKTSGLG